MSSVGVGQRAKFLTLLDNAEADVVELRPLYSIDVTVTKSPRAGVKCGAITIFKLNEVDLGFEEKLDLKRYDPQKAAAIARRAQEIQNDASSTTDMMIRDPIYFKETEGRWLTWAIDEAFRLFDSYGSSAKIALKCPRLKIEVVRSPKQISRLRSSPEDLFPVLKDIDRLLDGGFEYDPWRKQVRRGRISAEMMRRG